MEKFVAQRQHLKVEYLGGVTILAKKVKKYLRSPVIFCTRKFSTMHPCTHMATWSLRIDPPSSSKG